MGCTMTVGEQAMNIGRNAALAAGFPETVPGTTVDRQCGSAQQAVHFAAQAVMSGAMDIVIGAGIESMTRVPIGSTTDPGPGEAYGPTVHARYNFIHQGLSAEAIAERWKITRPQMDAFALESHRRAGVAQDEGRFRHEIIPLEAATEGHPDAVLDFDEGVRRGSTIEKLAALVPAFSENGLITAASSSQISDGAAAVLIMSEERAVALGLRPRARFHTFAVAANDPVIMLTAVIPATSLVLEKAKMKLADMDVIEINEAFASVVLAWESEFHPDMTTVNPNGGAIAIGHPTGLGSPTDGHHAQPVGTDRRPLRPPDHVRGRRPGQRHHHRTAGLAGKAPVATVLVTGGTGSLGSRLIPRLMARGHGLRSLSRHGRPAAGRPTLGGVTYAQGDVQSGPSRGPPNSMSSSTVSSAGGSSPSPPTCRSNRWTPAT